MWLRCSCKLLVDTWYFIVLCRLFLRVTAASTCRVSAGRLQKSPDSHSTHLKMLVLIWPSTTSLTSSHMPATPSLSSYTQLESLENFGAVSRLGSILTAWLWAQSAHSGHIIHFQTSSICHLYLKMLCFGAFHCCIWLGSHPYTSTCGSKEKSIMWQDKS